MKKATKYSIKLIIIFSFSFFIIAGEVSIPKFATVIFPGGKVFRLEIAANQQQWVRGLMFRKKLPEKGGMIFVYPQENFYSMWMKNCFISLDLIWLDPNGRIVYIVENAPPCHQEPCPVYQAMVKAKFVIELKGGTAKKLGLKIGDRVDIIFPRNFTTN